MEVRQIEHPEVALHVVAIRVDNEKAGASCSGFLSWCLKYIAPIMATILLFCFNLYASLAVILPRRMCPFRPAKKPSTPGETGKWRDKRIKTRESM